MFFFFLFVFPPPKVLLMEGRRHIKGRNDRFQHLIFERHSPSAHVSDTLVSPWVLFARQNMRTQLRLCKPRRIPSETFTLSEDWWNQWFLSGHRCLRDGYLDRTNSVPGNSNSKLLTLIGFCPVVLNYFLGLLVFAFKSGSGRWSP